MSWVSIFKHTFGYENGRDGCLTRSGATRSIERLRPLSGLASRDRLYCDGSMKSVSTMSREIIVAGASFLTRTFDGLDLKLWAEDIERHPNGW